MIFGVKKSGTSLFRQLLDGHHQGIVLPGEFDTYRLCYSKHYESKKHLLIDYLCTSRDNLRGSAFKMNPNSFSAIEISTIERITVNELISSFDGSIKGLKTEEESAIFNRPIYFDTLEQELDQIQDPIDILNAEFLAYQKACKSPIPMFRAFKEVSISNLGCSHIGDLLDSNSVNKLIFVRRDPRAILNSRIKSDLKHFGKVTDLRRKVTLLRTINYVFNDLEYILSKFKDRILIVDYEDLVTSAEEVMKKVAIFLDVQYNSDLLTPSILGHSSKVTTWSGANTPSSKHISNESRDSWKNELSLFERLLCDTINNKLIVNRGYKKNCFPLLTKILVYVAKMLKPNLFKI